MKAVPHVNLLSGRVGDYSPDLAAHHPSLEPLAAGESVIRGGGAALSDGVDHVFTSAGGASVTGSPIVIRGGGA